MVFVFRIKTYLCVSRYWAEHFKESSLWRKIYGIFILNFRSGRTDKVRTDVVWADRETGKPVTTSFRGIYIEMPLFNKKQKGIALDLIKECTGLTDEEIMNL